VEAAGQLFHLFRDGLDYAFILRRSRDEWDAGRVIRIVPSQSESWGRLRCLRIFSRSMSLYTARPVGLVSPLGVATSLPRQRVHRMSPVIHFTLTSEGNHCDPSHQLNPRPQALDVRIYVRSCFFVFSLSATRRAGKTSSQLR
jgi:hypothetical protein